MSKDQLLGVLVLLGSIVVIGFYGWLIYAGLSWWAFFIVATVAVVGVMGIIAWIGWVMATTPPPAPLEDITGEAAAEAQGGASEGETTKKSEEST